MKDLVLARYFSVEFALIFRWAWLMSSKRYTEAWISTFITQGWTAIGVALIGTVISPAKALPGVIIFFMIMFVIRPVTRLQERLLVKVDEVGITISQRGDDL